MLDQASCRSRRIAPQARVAIALMLLLVLFVFAAPASATFRGRDGDLLVEAQHRGPLGSPQLWLTSADGRHARLIFTAGRCAHVDGAQFLPSGKQLVVQESFGCVPFVWGLVLVNITGHGSRRLSLHSSSLTGAVTPGSVAISPDGRMLADSHQVRTKTEIDFVSLRSGSTVRSVRSALLPPTAWLPTGRLVSMFPGPGPSGFGGIGFADVNGSHVRHVGVSFGGTSTVLAGRVDPAIPSVVPSPDGSRFVVLGGRITSTCTPSTLISDASGASGAHLSVGTNDQEPIDCPSDLYLVSARGRQARRLTHDGNELNASPPIWSPDGTQIILSGDRLLRLSTGRATSLRVRVPGRFPTILDWQALPA